MKGGVRQRGEKYSYYFKYQDEMGKWKTKEKGGFTTKKEANSALRKAIVDFEETGKMTKSTNYTLSEYTEYWFVNVAELTLKYESLRQYRSTFKNHIQSEIGNVKLDKLTPVLLQKFFTKKQKVLGSSSMGSIKRLLSNVFKFAIKQGVIKHNPLAQVQYSVKLEKREFCPLGIDELKEIESVLKGTKYLVPFLIAIHTGMRRSEVLGLTWDNINFEEKTISINKQLQLQNKKLVLESPKTKTSIRKILMTNALEVALIETKRIQEINKQACRDEYFPEEDFVCCTDDGYPIPPASISSFTTLLSKRLGYNFKFHDFRHAHATLMLEANANIKVLQERLGHADIGTTLNTYSHVTKKLENESVTRFDNLLK